MPVIKSAKKKLRQDKKRASQNKKVEDVVKNLLKNARKSPSEKTIKEAFSAIDKAAKQNIIHKNKAARVKSSLSKLTKSETVKTPEKTTKSKPQKSSKK